MVWQCPNRFVEVFNSVPLDFTDSVKYKLYGCSEWGPRVPRQNLVKSPQVAFPASPGSCFAWFFVTAFELLSSAISGCRPAPPTTTPPPVDSPHCWKSTDIIGGNHCRRYCRWWQHFSRRSSELCCATSLPAALFQSPMAPSWSLCQDKSNAADPNGCRRRDHRRRIPEVFRQFASASGPIFGRLEF